MEATATATVTINTVVKVLNASFEELGATKLGRAIALVSSGKAVVEEEDTFRVIRSIGGVVIPFPKVIRMLNYIKVPFHFSEEYWSKAGVLRRDKSLCAYCGKKATTVDHIYPKSRFEGNADTWMNTIASCQPCNGKKADRTPEEAGMVLTFRPSVPMKLYYRSGNKPGSRRK